MAASFSPNPVPAPKKWQNVHARAPLPSMPCHGSVKPATCIQRAGQLAEGGLSDAKGNVRTCLVFMTRPFEMIFIAIKSPRLSIGSHIRTRPNEPVPRVRLILNWPSFCVEFRGVHVGAHTRSGWRVGGEWRWECVRAGGRVAGGGCS